MTFLSMLKEPLSCPELPQPLSLFIQLVVGRSRRSFVLVDMCHTVGETPLFINIFPATSWFILNSQHSTGTKADIVLHFKPDIDTSELSPELHQRLSEDVLPCTTLSIINSFLSLLLIVSLESYKIQYNTSLSRSDLADNNKLAGM